MLKTLFLSDPLFFLLAMMNQEIKQFLHDRLPVEVTRGEWEVTQILAWDLDNDTM